MASFLVRGILVVVCKRTQRQGKDTVCESRARAIREGEWENKRMVMRFINI